MIRAFALAAAALLCAAAARADEKPVLREPAPPVRPAPARPAPARPSPTAGAQAVRAPDEPMPRAVPDPLESPAMNPLAVPVVRVRIVVRAIAATRGGAEPRLEIDGRLLPIDADLRAFAAQFTYRGYRLVEERVFELGLADPGEMELPAGRALRVEPLRVLDAGRVQVRLQVLGPHPSHVRQLHTDYSIARGRTILVGGYHVDPAKPEQGTLLLAVTQGGQ